MGTRRKSVITWAETHTGEGAIGATDLVPWPWGSIQGRRAHLTDWRTTVTNRKALGSLESAGEECVGTGLLQDRVERVE